MHTTKLLEPIKAQVAMKETKHAKTSKAARGIARRATKKIKKITDKIKKN